MSKGHTLLENLLPRIYLSRQDTCTLVAYMYMYMYDGLKAPPGRQSRQEDNQAESKTLNLQLARDSMQCYRFPIPRADSPAFFNNAYSTCTWQKDLMSEPTVHQDGVRTRNAHGTCHVHNTSTYSAHESKRHV